MNFNEYYEELILLFKYVPRFCYKTTLDKNISFII